MLVPQVSRVYSHPDIFPYQCTVWQRLDEAGLDGRVTSAPTTANRRCSPTVFSCLGAGHELNGALAGDAVVVDDAREREHGQTSVLELGKLEARDVLALAKAKGIEAEVAGLATRALPFVEASAKARRGRRKRGEVFVSIRAQKDMKRLFGCM